MTSKRGFDFFSSPVNPTPGLSSKSMCDLQQQNQAEGEQHQLDFSQAAKPIKPLNLNFFDEEADIDQIDVQEGSLSSPTDKIEPQEYQQEVEQNDFQAPEGSLDVQTPKKKQKKLTDNHFLEQTTAQKSNKREKGQLRGLCKIAALAHSLITNTNSNSSFDEMVRKLSRVLEREKANQELSYENTIISEGSGSTKVKRRIYDVLNVLLAAGAIKKTGTRSKHGLIFKRNSFLSEDEKGHRELANLQEELKSKTEIIERKKGVIAELKRKTRHLRSHSNLVQRNLKQKINPTPKSHKICEPFVLITCEDKQLAEEVRMETNFNSRTFQAEVPEKFQIYGDLDAVKFIPLDEGKKGL